MLRKFLTPRGLIILFFSAFAAACGGKASVNIDVLFRDPTSPSPADPPYGSEVIYPSGLRVGLVPDATLTATYPSPSANPFGELRTQQYQRVG